MTINETAELLRRRDNHLIITHRRPDGDAVGCAGALVLGLRAIGKTAYALYNPDTTERYAPYIEDCLAPDGFSAETVITVDTASEEMFPPGGADYKGRVTLAIDHHPSNTGYAELTCNDSRRASCGEVIYDILLELSGSVDAETAKRLYVALSTDTGCFAFANTTANTLRVASLLIEAGAPHRELNRKLFRTRTIGRIKMEGMIYSGMEFFYDGRVAIATVTKEMERAAGTTEDDLDDIASIPGSIDGVLAGITVRELTGPGDCKVSVRTSPLVSANGICQKFGGGGHAMAAGFSQHWTVEEIKRRLSTELDSFLPDA